MQFRLAESQRILLRVTEELCPGGLLQREETVANLTGAGELYRRISQARNTKGGSCAHGADAGLVQISRSGEDAVRYRVVIIVAVCYMVGLAGTMTEFSIPPLTSIFQRHLHILAPSAGLLMSLFALATVMTALPAGSLTHRFGAKATGMAGLGLSAAGTMALTAGYGQADFGAVLAARFVSGMGFGLISVAAPLRFPRKVLARHAAKAMGVWAAW